jgi:hypothetical protein
VGIERVAEEEIENRELLVLKVANQAAGKD